MLPARGQTLGNLICEGRLGPAYGKLGGAGLREPQPRSADSWGPRPAWSLGPGQIGAHAQTRPRPDASLSAAPPGNGPAGFCGGAAKFSVPDHYISSRRLYFFGKSVYTDGSCILIGP